jgi:nickel-type superoxide dismutase maturation protease
MLPLLQPGEEVLVDLAAYKRSPPQVGDIIVLGHPTQTNLHIIKRVTSVNEAGLCFVLGDNQAHSSDSRTFGLISPSLVLGKVTSRFTMNNEP